MFKWVQIKVQEEEEGEEVVEVVGFHQHDCQESKGTADLCQIN